MKRANSDSINTAKFSEQRYDRCILEDIHWENIYLHFIFLNPTEKEIILCTEGQDPLLFKLCEREDIGDGRYKITLNITMARGRQFLENGKWSIGYYLDDCFINCAVSDALLEKLPTLDRVFRYSDTIKYAYTVNFSADTLDDEIAFVNMFSFFMMINDEPERQRIVFESETFPLLVRRCFVFIKRFMVKALFRIFTLFRKRAGNRILLITESSPSLEGNLSVLLDKMKIMGIEDQFQIRTSARNTQSVKHSNSSWITVLKLVADADYIFVDNYVPLFNYLSLRKNVKFVQVWHAGVGFKAVGYARFGKTGSPHPVISAHRKYTSATAPSENLISVYSEVFGIERKAFLPIGLLRFGEFFNNERIEHFNKEFYQDHPDIKGKKIVLFAPTYRGAGQKSAYYNYTKLNLQEIFDFCGEEYVFVMKMHPYTKDTKEYYEKWLPTLDLDIDPDSLEQRIKPDLSMYEPRIQDFTGKYDINDLLHISDILITDYSSVYYEFSVLKRPILFYTYDRLIYEYTRGVHQRIKDAAPGKVCDSFEELMNALRNSDFELEKTIQFAKNNIPENPEMAVESLIRAVLYNESGEMK